ncbi:TetR/AcrR family transcriptional regulator [Kineococcus sp. TBRC 1896]|uniref:TetR/AcrR family transcriptional regulator n=1 Tax=Kineococcus mangrovi TaxID=1660183 RepID=A0ABV4I9Y0_9ACTN
MATTPARPGRGRPQEGSARTRLLDAAEELFYAHGVAATGVDAVLRRAHVAPATLYAHFGGKDGLVTAYLQRRHERWRQVWDAALERAGDDPVARLLSVFDALEDLQDVQDAARGCAFLAAAVEVVEPEHPAHEWLAADTGLLTGRLHRCAAEAGARDPAALAAELLVVYDGALAARARRAIAPRGAVTATASRSAARALAVGAVTRHLAGPAGS